jgi:hypothetical protein
MQPNCQDRNAALLAAVLAGQTWRGAAASAGISTERVRQICRGLLRRLRQSAPAEAVPQHNPFAVAELRAHKDFWLRRLEDLHDDRPSLRT